MTRYLPIMAVPFGSLLVLAIWLMRCRHRHEMLDRDEMGMPVLRCVRCLQRRPHPLAGLKPAYRRTQDAGGVEVPRPMTGIERELARNLVAMPQRGDSQRRPVMGDRLP